MDLDEVPELKLEGQLAERTGIRQHKKAGISRAQSKIVAVYYYIVPLLGQLAILGFVFQQPV